jgi:CoA:oxalate CoA-transferase
MTAERLPPLHDILVLDVTRVLAGPFCSLVLGDLGATVVKIERPGIGDESRWFPPHAQDGTSAYFASVNRGKQSVALDLSTPGGADLLRRLAGKADVLVENFRPGTLQGWGIAYDDIVANNAGLVWCAISGFGETGARSGLPAYDIVIQAMSGFMSITGEADGPPTRAGSSIADLAAGLYGAVSVCAALSDRARDPAGRGRYLDVAMLDSMVSLLENAVVRTALEGVAPGRIGSRHPAITPFQPFEAADGILVVAAGHDILWRRLCETLGLDDLADDPRFATIPDRTANHAELESALAPAFALRPRDDWLAALGTAGIPCAPVNDVADVLADPHLAARGLFATDPASGLTMATTASAVGAPVHVPRLGEDTRAVLAELLGLGDSDIGELEKSGAVAAE